LLGFIDQPMPIPLILMLMASISDGKKDFIACKQKAPDGAEHVPMLDDIVSVEDRGECQIASL